MPDSAHLLKLRLEREIAARKSAENLLERKSNELDASHHELLAQIAQVTRLSAAIDSAGEGIAIADTDGIFTYMNNAHAQMFGFACGKDLIGQSWTRLYDSEALTRFDRDVMPQVAREGRWSGEMTGRGGDGAIVFQDLALTQLRDGGILCCTRDTGLRRIREKETADLRRRVIEADRAAALDQLVETVTHDFSNFLGAIDASMTLLAKQYDQSEPRKLMMSVFDALHQARSVLNQLHPGYTAPAEQICDLTDLVPRLCDLMAPLLDITQTAYCKVPDTPLFVLAEPTLFARSMTNMFKNAIEAMTGTGCVLRIEVEMLPGYAPPTLPFAPAARLIFGSAIDGAVARIIIHDEGIGMDQAVLDHALERFVTTKSNGRRRGIGLTSVKDLVETCGGGLAIFSTAGVGSVFVLDLPARANADVPADTAEHMILPDTIANVLLVDDDPIALNRLDRLFRARGWEVASFSDPREALAFLEQAPNFIQLLVTDRSMPEISGDELAVRAKQIRPDLPIILCSNALKSAIPTEIDATLAKPPSGESLQAILVRLNLAG
ncbi:response regulator [Sphingomonas sp. UV9]|uniref:ATP-binding response regulator n=1 Tax=Sphingomonas sp. UV9 TaxID=1851410 RepID=UPI000FFC8B4E|nr:response regulator [Sphingomonas sp. UV9]RXD07295.1 response regulator [Sphingomonas sp. UV9]